MNNHSNTNSETLCNGRRKYCGIITLAIPFLAMLIMLTLNILSYSNTEYRVKITGYDPRDLLRGHYLVFQYAWPENTTNQCSKENPKDCCACFHDQTESAPISFMPCDKKPELQSCRNSLRMTHFWNNTLQPHENLRRYYIPEQHASQLESMLISGKHQFEVGLILSRNTIFKSAKSGKVKMLYIDNMSLPQFLFQQAHKPKPRD